QADGLDLGADDYMTKPFSYVVLAARLRALLRRGARPRPAVLAAGDLHLDPAARTVRRGEAAIELTAREFALLEYLMRPAGLAVALALAALLLASAVRSALINGLDVGARQGAVEVATLLDQGRLPSPVPVPPDTVTVQVLDASGRIVNVSAGADRLVPMLSPEQARAAARTGQAQMLPGPPLGMPSLLRVVAVRASGQHVVIAAVSFAQVHESLATLARTLFIGTPLLFGLLALAIWLVTGYTLRPIAALRRGAAEVTGTGVPRALPVPPARDEVRSLAVTLNDMLSRLAEAQQRQRDLVSDTAHELRSPIASIRAQLEVALDHPDGLDWTETARDVHADTLRLARLTEDLLLLARLDGQPLRR